MASLGVIPRELQLQIIHSLTFEDRIRLSLTCRHLHKTFSTSDKWVPIFTRLEISTHNRVRQAHRLFTHLSGMIPKQLPFSLSPPEKLKHPDGLKTYRQLLNRDLLALSMTHTYYDTYIQKFSIETRDGSLAMCKIFTLYKGHMKYNGFYREKTSCVNAELEITRLLSRLVLQNKTPHILLPITEFVTDLALFEQIARESSSEQSQKFIHKLTEYTHLNLVPVCIYEPVRQFDDYLAKTAMTVLHWKVIIFQVLFTLAIIHETYPGFRHNELKLQAIMISLTMSSPVKDEYTLGRQKFLVPNLGISVRIGDFFLSAIEGVVENQIIGHDWCEEIGIRGTQNRFADMYVFLYLLNKVCNEPVVSDFVQRIINRPDGGPGEKRRYRWLGGEETTPARELVFDEFFSEFRLVAPLTTAGCATGTSIGKH